MAKQHISISKIRNYWSKTFRCEYCELQYIMRGTEPHYYNSGVYGWNCDIYCDFSNDIAITTGYRNMTGKRIPDELINKYSDIAKSIIEKPFTTPYEEIRKALEENKQNFFNELAKI